MCGTCIALGKAQSACEEKMPVLLFGQDFWTRIINFDAISEAGTISPEDLDLFQFVETAQEAWDIVKAT